MKIEENPSPITACPLCVREKTGQLNELIYEGDGIVSCRKHGKMQAKDIRDLASGKISKHPVR